jgi:hypothetical protein
MLFFLPDGRRRHRLLPILRLLLVPRLVPFVLIVISIVRRLAVVVLFSIVVLLLAVVGFCEEEKGQFSERKMEKYSY